LPKNFGQKRLVGFSAGEIPTAPQHQGLIQVFFQTIVPLFHIPILMRTMGLGLGTGEPIMPGQGGVLFGEDLQITHRMH